ncbi:MAG: DNA primase, partial [Deltaproteobacteria bacterium]|nr:DNA primase [Deltaproteobacteria bacterium]
MTTRPGQDNAVDLVRRAADIVEVVGEHVVLKRRGAEFWGLCPFHDEKTPSFAVHPEKQMYYCHGCHAGGSVFDFLMNHQRLDFKEALALLAARYNVTLPETRGSGRSKKEREDLQGVNAAAARYFARMLRDPAGRAAREYLEKRGLAGETVREFGLGYAPAGWNNLLDHLRRRGVKPETAVRAGLAVRSDKGTFYDRFRDRVMFPISDSMGRVAGFGGRTLSPDQKEAKYLNSAQTPVYDKKRTLYALDRSRPHCRKADCVFVVEGYMDAL